MARKNHPRHLTRSRLDDEVGRLDRTATHRLALAYPSPYRVALSSLGYQSIYRLIQTSQHYSCERVVAPDEPLDWNRSEPIVSLESEQPLSAFPLIAFSVAYELELMGLLQMLQHAGIPVRREERSEEHPFVLAGGPLSFSNPTPLGPFVDAVVMGEAEELLEPVLKAIFSHGSRKEQLLALSSIEHVWIPALHGEKLPGLGCADNSCLPAWAPIRTPNAELRDMFLVEVVRGCSRGCGYCVMRRSTNGGMWIIPQERILEVIPKDAKRVGLVGASVSDHPKIIEIVRTLAERGTQVGLSSLRPDRLTEEFVRALAAGGYKTVTTAMDGPSEKVRAVIERRTTTEHLRKVASNCRAAGIERLKLYLMVGLPQESLEDIEECAELVRELSKVIPISLGISPFCPKRNTPLAQSPFAGTDLVDAHLEHLRKKLAGRGDMRATSSRWAWVEAVMAQGGFAEGLALLDATQKGAGFSAFRKAFGALGHNPRDPSVPGGVPLSASQTTSS